MYQESLITKQTTNNIKGLLSRICCISLSFLITSLCFGHGGNSRGDLDHEVIWSDREEALNLMSMAMHLDLLDSKSLMIQRKVGPELLKDGIKYIKAGEVDNDDERFILHYAINVDMFHGLNDHDKDFFRERYSSQWELKQDGFSLKGIGFFYDEDTMDFLKKVAEEQPQHKKLVEEAEQVINKRKTRDYTRVPYFSHEQSEKELEIVYCALAGSNSVGDGLMIRKRIIETIDVPEALTGIRLYERSNDKALKYRVKGMLKRAAKWSPEKVELNKLVKDFLEGKKIEYSPRPEKPMPSSEEEKESKGQEKVNTHKEPNQTTKSHFGLLIIIGLLLIVIACMLLKGKLK